MNKKVTILLGDIHGQFMIVPHLMERYDIRDANVIQLGDFGVGFHKPNYYKTIFNKLNKRLEKRNIHLYAFRGNHDDPSWFKETNNPFDYSNITLLADYTEFELLGKKFLCIGGATSIDRTWEKRIPGKSWWSDERIVPNYNFEFTPKKYDWVLTHTRPLKANTEGIANNRISDWLKRDEQLHNHLISEGALLNAIHDLTQPLNWAYGHFHESQIYNTEGTTFRCLAINELYTIYG